MNLHAASPAVIAQASTKLALDLLSWVPIRTLGPRHRGRIAAHLLQLDERDRYLRFGYPATDEQIRKYAAALDFERDELFGIFNRKLELVAMAHLAYGPSDDKPMAEFGVSVLAKVRGRGLGGRLFERASLHARNRGVGLLMIHALSENTAMLKIARKAGATVERDGSESEAWLRLPDDTVVSHVGQLVEQQAAEFDYGLKVNAYRIHEFLEALLQMKAQMNESVHVAEE